MHVSDVAGHVCPTTPHPIPRDVWRPRHRKGRAGEGHGRAETTPRATSAAWRVCARPASSYFSPPAAAVRQALH